MPDFHRTFDPCPREAAGGHREALERAVGSLGSVRRIPLFACVVLDRDSGPTHHIYRPATRFASSDQIGVFVENCAVSMRGCRDTGSGRRPHEVIKVDRVTMDCPIQDPNNAEAHVKCPQCGVDLLPTIRHKIKVNTCPSGHGMWLEHDELQQLEDEVFDFGDRWKGSLVVDSAATTDSCPECPAHLQRFRYRFYDLEMEFCPNQHGYWLADDEDTRVLELMKREEADLQRKLLAEDRWSATLRHMRSRSFFGKLRDLF